jgi:hypothetical protein
VDIIFCITVNLLCGCGNLFNYIKPVEKFLHGDKSAKPDAWKVYLSEQQINFAAAIAR